MSRTTSLADAFGELAASLPTSENDSRAFTAEDLDDRATVLTTDRLVVQKVYREYDDVRVDAVRACLERPTARLLGLVILREVFRPQSVPTKLMLTHPESDMRAIIVDGRQVPHGGWHRLTVKAASFDYWPSAVERFPGLNWGVPAKLPVAAWTSLGPRPATLEEWIKSDALLLCGPAAGLTWLAQLLLDIGNPASTTLRCSLESGANGGVEPGSAELDFQLPGLGAWVDDLFS